MYISCINILKPIAHLSTALDPSTTLDDVQSKAQRSLRSHPLYQARTATVNNQSMWYHGNVWFRLGRFHPQVGVEKQLENPVLNVFCSLPEGTATSKPVLVTPWRRCKNFCEAKGRIPSIAAEPWATLLNGRSNGCWQYGQQSQPGMGGIKKVL